MGQPFVLQFKPFAGRAIESLMFDHAGYEYLYNRAAHAKEQLSAFAFRVARLVEKGEDPKIVACCEKCNKPALFISGKRGGDGVGFGDFLCADCAKAPFPGEEFFPLKFSTIVRFAYVADRKLFIRHLKTACGFRASGRVTAEKAHAFFYPPDVARSANKVTARRGPALPFK